MAAPKNNEEKVHDMATSGWQQSDIASKYKLAENATRPYAASMMKKASLATHVGDINAFDLACGTGSVEVELYNALPKEKWGDGSVKVFGGDVSDSMLGYLKERGEKEGWTGLSTGIVDGNNIKLSPNTYTHVFVNFGIFVLASDTTKKLQDLLRPGGFLAISSWSYLPWHSLVRTAISRLENPPVCPSAKEVESTIFKNKPWGTQAYIKTVLSEAGLVDVETEEFENNTDCGSPRQFVESMGMPLRMLSVFWEEGRREEELKRVSTELEKLAEEEFGKEGPVKMVFKGIVGTGRKAL